MTSPNQLNREAEEHLEQCERKMQVKITEDSYQQD